MIRTLCHMLALLTITMFLARVATAENVTLDEASPQQAMYWWQDEIRSVAFAVSTARSGQIAQWPKMSVPAGQAVLPLPIATGAISADGHLDEEAWKHATSFPVGPLFDAWQAGPFTLQVSACRDEKNLYLAIVSPRELGGLGTLTTDGRLFAVGDQPFHVGPAGAIPASSLGRTDRDQVIELALPFSSDVNLSFPVELVRRLDGKLPDGAADLGLDHLTDPPDQRARFRSPWLWLEPITIRLRPAEVAVRLSAEPSPPGPSPLVASIAPAGQTPVVAEVPITRAEIGTTAGSPAAGMPGAAGGGVYCYSWKPAAAFGPWSAEGFLYVEPASPVPPPSQASRATWRGDYCRARQLRAAARLRLLDAPLLFVQQHPYFAAHIYDDFYTWYPGGGIYVLENPAASFADRHVRPIIDANTNETLGPGVYRDPDLSWDARQIRVCLQTGRRRRDQRLYHRPGWRQPPTADGQRPAPRHHTGVAGRRPHRVHLHAAESAGAVFQFRRRHVAHHECRRQRPVQYLGEQRHRIRSVRVGRRPDPVRPLGIRRQDGPVHAESVDHVARRADGGGPVCQ